MAESYRPAGLKRLEDVDMKSTEYGEEIVFIEGVVSARSQGAAVRDEEFNSHSFKLVAWRAMGGPVVEQELIVLRAIPKNHNWSADFPPNSTQRMGVLLSVDKSRAVFNQSFPLGQPDLELAASAERRRAPEVIQSNVLGELAFRAKNACYEAEVIWNGESTPVCIPAEDDGSIGDALETAKKLWADSKRWKERIDEFAVSELLPIKNASWLDENEQELSAADFLARMDLASITIHDEGRFEFWHYDGDMFYDHSILVTGNLVEGPTRADIPG